MKRGLLLGLIVGVVGGALTGVLLALSHRRSGQLSLEFEPRIRRYTPFRNRIRIRFKESADFIRPSI